MTTALWVCLGVFIFFVLIFLWATFSVTKQEDRSARYREHLIDPFSDVEITRTGTDG
jgi:hypothetical protein